ncbi:MAG TPA: J domain-containing protein [Patescibacteria group bacterium]|jgi:molecular chaperone DnaJ|nr:J domain-containing protein [Patescibacteria group bacterium]
MKKDYFAILGLKPGASEKEIRSAYKKLAKKYHPDVNPNKKQGDEKFKEISEAYEVLTDPEKRRKWESGDTDFESFFRESRGSAGRGAPRGGASSTFRFEDSADLGSIFGDLFSGAGMGREASYGPAQGADLQFQASITFEDAVKGTTLRIPLARTVSCDSCRGEGFVRSGKPKNCANCGGSGRVTSGRGPMRMATACPSCHGTGKAPGEPCRTCGGTGTQHSNETIQVRIPPGAEDGSRVRVAGKGEAGALGGPPGDLFVVLRVTPHAYFRRDGKDIILELPLTVTEAALGTRIDVPTVDGRVTLTVPAGSSSGQRLRLKGRGVPSRNGPAPGDQIVMLQIVTPKSLSAESKKILEELQRLNPDNPRSALGW